MLKKKTFKVALQYLFNIFILLNIVSYLNFKLKIHPKMCTFKNLEKILQTCVGNSKLNIKADHKNLVFICLKFCNTNYF